MVRDLGQAQNLKWIMDQEGSEAKMITWAHNAHVNNAQEYGHDMMGVHLRKLYGDQLKIFGFFFLNIIAKYIARRPSYTVNAATVSIHSHCKYAAP